MTHESSNAKAEGAVSMPSWSLQIKAITFHIQFVDVGFWPSKPDITTFYSYPKSSYKDKSRVNWVTASELDGDTFETQRGADGILIESPFRYSSRWLFSSS